MPVLPTTALPFQPRVLLALATLSPAADARIVIDAAGGSIRLVDESDPQLAISARVSSGVPAAASLLGATPTPSTPVIELACEDAATLAAEYRDRADVLTLERMDEFTRYRHRRVHTMPVHYHEDVLRAAAPVAGVDAAGSVSALGWTDRWDAAVPARRRPLAAAAFERPATHESTPALALDETSARAFLRALDGDSAVNPINKIVLATSATIVPDPETPGEAKVMVRRMYGEPTRLQVPCTGHDAPPIALDATGIRALLRLTAADDTLVADGMTFQLTADGRPDVVMGQGGCSLTMPRSMSSAQAIAATLAPATAQESVPSVAVAGARGGLRRI